MISSLYEVALSSVDPSLSPLGGSIIAMIIKIVAIPPITGVTRNDHLQSPVNFSVSEPTI